MEKLKLECVYCLLDCAAFNVSQEATNRTKALGNATATWAYEVT